jgi:nicotinamidase-related amidase
MTHMCVNSTARGAFSLGHSPAVVAGATATRALPGATAIRALPGSAGEPVSAAALQAASLAALADLFAVVVPEAADVP